MMKVIFAMAFATTSLLTFAQVERKLFTMEKNHNPGNIMMIHSQTDLDCKFVTSKKNNEHNFLEFYWIMDFGHSKKDVHPLIRDEIKKRVSFSEINDRRDSFRVTLNDLKELRHDLTNTTMEIISEMNQGKCEVKSMLTLGASGNYRKMDLKRTYCEVSKNLIGLPNGCNTLLFEGKDASNGELIKVTFKKK